LYSRLREGGEAAIDQLISDFQSENLWLDFKRSADSGSGTKIHQSDRENLAKAISGFANSDGGVIVWGVDCKRDPSTGADLPSAKIPIEQPHRFISWLEGIGSSCVTPPAQNIEHLAILAPGSNQGFVATLIPRSDSAPHQCIQPTNKLQYYMRAGSNFLAVPHAILSGMFGRRPQPKLFTFYEGKPSILADSKVLELDFAVRLMNEGPAPASDAYISYRIIVPGPNCRLNFSPRSSEQWVPHQAYGVFFNLTSTPSFRLAPQTPVRPALFKIHFAPPFENRYVFEMHFGCQGAEPGHVLVEFTANEAQQAYERAFELLKTVSWKDALGEIFSTFLGQKGDAA
jgi:hypothetical protein